MENFKMPVNKHTAASACESRDPYYPERSCRKETGHDGPCVFWNDPPAASTPSQVTDIEVKRGGSYPEYQAVIIHFKDGETMEIKAGSVMYDQYSSSPCLKINGRIS